MSNQTSRRFALYCYDTGLMIKDFGDNVFDQPLWVRTLPDATDFTTYADYGDAFNRSIQMGPSVMVKMLKG
jgi:hypothetical protein